MKIRCPANEASHPARRCLAWLACFVIAGCAPDSVRNYQATGYNAYLDTIATACNPLMLGINNVSEWLQNQGSNDPNYTYFLDQTSRLYYGTISADTYRQGINGFFGPGSANEGSFACIFRNLPAQRPSAPGQQPGYGVPPPM